jgi:hypothetical protein
MRTLQVRALFSVPLGYNYRGHPVDPGVMLTARIFNLAIAPTLDAAPRSVFHARMEEFGLDFPSTGISVGHRGLRSKGGSDVGANLFAQHTEDNYTALGAEVASDEELFFYWRQDSMSNKEQFLQSKVDHSKTLRAFLRGPDLFYFRFPGSFTAGITTPLDQVLTSFTGATPV